MSALRPPGAPSQGDFPPSYTGPRPDIQRLVPRTATSILDVGCADGTLGATLKEKMPAHVVGIEVSPDMAAVARTRLDEVLVGDAEEILSSDTLSLGHFDVIVFADLLEHLIDPWDALRNATTHLAIGGVVIASIPNVRHVSTLFALTVRGIWPYRSRGIHDSTHLRFFTRRNILEMFAGVGLSIERIDANYRLVERPHRLNRLAPLVARLGLRPFLAFQYLVRAEDRGSRRLPSGP